MYYYRITKYNPKYRDGIAYTKMDEWISISCIGDPKYRNPTANEYLRVEDNYWNTMKYLLQLCHITSMRMKRIEKHHDLPFFFTQNKFFDIRPLEEAIKKRKPIGIDEIEMATRLCLREEMWCMLEGEGKTFIHFGYDYYMFFGTEIDHTIDFSFVPKGIYIEDFKSPYVK